MPVRSSVCTYSPSSVSSKYSSSIYQSPNSLSIGHYKPLGSTSTILPTTTRSTYGTLKSSSAANSSSLISPLTSSSYKPSSSLASGSHSSLGYSSTSSGFSPSHVSSTGNYRPLSSTYSSFNSRYGGATPQVTANTYSRYSSASSTSSLSSANSLLDRGDNSTSGYYSSNSSYNYPSTTSRRLSHTSSIGSSDSLPGQIPRGLVNLGNTCYMNAVLQSLYSVETFRNFILRSSSHDKILTSELSDLFNSMKNPIEPVSPANFKYAFSRHQSKFSGLGQQDSQEFLRYLINGIHEEFNSASKRPRRTVPFKSPKSAAEAWKQYREIVDDSPLVDMVVGQLCSTIVCSICQNKSNCWDPVWDLSLPLVRGRHSCKLSDVIQDFTAKETLDLDERPICSNCKKATRSTKQISMCRLPELLILHLKKFTNDGYKLSSPEIKIDKVLTLNGSTYNLKACVSHHGHSSSSGHYTSHCEYSNRWYHFNDDRVRDVTSSFDSENLNDAYVLFYKQSSSSSLRQSKL